MNELADTIVSRFLNRAARSPEREAYSAFPSGALKPLGGLTWGDWATQARAVAGSLLAQNALPGDRVAIFSNNRMLWPATHVGTAMAGLVTVGIHPDATHDQLESILQDCEPVVVVIDTLARLRKVREVQSQTLQTFITVCEDLEPLRSNSAEQVFEWQRWISDGAETLNMYSALRNRLTERINALTSDDVLVLDYDNDIGRGAALSHTNVIASTAIVSDLLKLELRDTIAACEPFATAAGRCIGIFALIEAGCRAAAIEIPNEFLTVAARAELTILPGKRPMFVRLHDAIEVATHAGASSSDAATRTLGEKCRAALVFCENLEQTIARDLIDAGIEVLSVYGKPQHLCACINTPVLHNAKTAGVAINGNSIGLGEYSELLVQRNHQTFAGYFNHPIDSQCAFTPDGFNWRTGDRATINDEGVVRILGRVVDLVTLASGAKVDVTQIESALEATPFVKHAACFGEGRDCIVAVLALRRDAVEKWAHAEGLVAPWEALVQHRLVRDEVARVVSNINERYAAATPVHRFAVTDGEFSVQGGELTPQDDIKRDVIALQFQHIIEELYAQ